MKAFALIAFLFTSVSALACPDISGEWKCEDSNGEKWTESIKKDGLKFVVVTEGETFDIYTDGRVQKDSVGNLNVAEGVLARMTELVSKILPDSAKAAIVLAAISKAGQNTKSLVKVERVYACQGPELKSDYKFSTQFNIRFLLSIDGLGTIKASEKLEGNKRTGTAQIRGSLKGAPTLSIGVPEQQASLDQDLSMTCVRP